MNSTHLFVVALATSFLAFTVGHNAARTSTPVQANAGKAVAAEAIYGLTLPDLAGTAQPMAQWAGRVLVVNYWATWCTPCRDEMPAFSHLHEKYVQRGVTFVGISIDEPEKIETFIRTTPVSYPLLIAGPGVLQATADLGNGPQGLPFTVIFNREGHIVSSKLGRCAEADLETLIHRSL